MKPTNDPRRELLEEIFLPATRCDIPPIADVLDSIRHEKRSRARRRGAVAVAAGVAVMLAVVSSWWTSRPPQSNASQVRVAATPGALSTADGMKVERVGDGDVLELLDSTPSALIEWPDGRRTLMVLVSPRRR